MDTTISPLTTEQEVLLQRLAEQRSQILARVEEGKIGAEQLQPLTELLGVLTILLHPVPENIVAHLQTAHTLARPYLERLPQYDPERLILVDEAHSYTPRKILRRVLDHMLDHLNQVEQWLTWRRDGVVPTPTDGWESSAQTFQEDMQPLSAEELQAWLWRIDLVAGLVVARAKQLSEDELDWTPPDGGWTLRRALHHLALTEVYYVVWIEEALPEEPVAAFDEASRRFVQRLRAMMAYAFQPGEVLFHRSADATVSPEQLAQLVIEEQRRILK